MPFSDSAMLMQDSPNGNNQSGEVLKRGITAAQAGNRPEARALLLQATELDPRNESAWLWLASISEYPEELLVFLDNVLGINPQNERALEWMAATKSLLAKTFVQRGIDAVAGDQKEYASDCFSQALEHDQQNAMAWMWMASLCDSTEGKMAYLERVLSIEPDNETAKAAFDAARQEIVQSQFARAKADAVSGKTADAIAHLDAVLHEAPELDEAWMLRFHLAESFDEKVTTLERALAANQNNAPAAANLEVLKSLLSSPQAKATVPSEGPEREVPFIADQSVEGPATAEALRLEDNVATDKSPTQDLELPDQLVTEIRNSFESKAEAVMSEMPAAALPAEGNFTESIIVDFEVTRADASISPEQIEPAPEFVEDEFEAAGSDAFAAESSEMDQTDVEIPVPDEYLYVEPSPSFVTKVERNDPSLTESTELDFQESLNLAFTPLSEAVEIPPETGKYPFGEERAVNPFDLAPASDSFNGYDTIVVSADDIRQTDTVFYTCPFCSAENESQAFVCRSCMCVLTLSDLEMLLANHDTDRAVVTKTVESLQLVRNSREMTEAELTTLGIGHLNLRNFDAGYACLQEAASINPDDILLNSQVNALHIRLEEIKRQEEVHDAMVKGKTILVVDDSPTVRKLISGKLEKCGHQVFCCADGVEAVERLQDLVPDLVLLDITMPRMDGYQVCKLIRSNTGTKNVPVVMISGKDGFFDKVRGRMAGTTGYITKPFGPETLMKAVELYLSKEHELVEANG
jgi:twitching motility two-component system response regulator PilG